MEIHTHKCQVGTSCHPAVLFCFLLFVLWSGRPYKSHDPSCLFFLPAHPSPHPIAQLFWNWLSNLAVSNFLLTSPNRLPFQVALRPHYHRDLLPTPCLLTMAIPVLTAWPPPLCRGPLGPDSSVFPADFLLYQPQSMVFLFLPYTLLFWWFHPVSSVPMISKSPSLV